MEGIPILSYVTLGLVTVWTILSLRKPRRRYPPGPKGLPVLGNVFDIPLENGWLIFDKWARQYGSDIVHVEALGKHIYVINSAKVAREIFDGRPHNYSDKEQSTMLLELSGWGRSWVMFPYGDYWRQHRRLFHQHFRAQSIPQYHQKQAAAARRLLQLLLDTPADFAKHIRYATGSSIVDVVYSFDTPPGDPRLEIVEAAMGTASELLHSGIYLVDVFPIFF